MAVYRSRSPIWKFIDGAPTMKAQCPRCNNIGDFKLAWDGQRDIFGLWWSWRVAVYCCPICPYAQDIPFKSIEKYLE